MHAFDNLQQFFIKYSFNMCESFYTLIIYNYIVNRKSLANSTSYVQIRKLYINALMLILTTVQRGNVSSVFIPQPDAFLKFKIN